MREYCPCGKRKIEGDLPPSSQHNQLAYVAYVHEIKHVIIGTTQVVPHRRNLCFKRLQDALHITHIWGDIGQDWGTPKAPKLYLQIYSAHRNLTNISNVIRGTDLEIEDMHKVVEL